MRFKCEGRAISSISPLSVTAIICTRNRSSALNRALHAMGKLQLNKVVSFELLIVDNGSTDETSNVAQRFAETAPFRVRYLSEPRPGLSFARNKGLAMATGDLIMLTDDDCLVAANWVHAALDVFGHDPLRLIGGRVDLFNKKQPSLIVRTGLERETLASVGSLFGFMHGANMAFGRAVVDRVGVFDIRLGAGTPLHSAEDTEFIYRVFIEGIPVTYEPTLLIHHDHGRIGGVKEAYLQERGYSIGMGAMLVKHLLEGRRDLIKPIYWLFRSIFRNWAIDRTKWRQPFVATALLTGAMQYLVQASWKSSS